MKRLFSIVIITVVLALIGFGFLWVKNEEVGQDVSEFNPMRRILNKQNHTGTMLKKPTTKKSVSINSGNSGINSGSTTASGETTNVGEAVTSEIIIKK